MLQRWVGHWSEGCSGRWQSHLGRDICLAGQRTAECYQSPPTGEGRGGEGRGGEGRGWGRGGEGRGWGRGGEGREGGGTGDGTGQDGEEIGSTKTMWSLHCTLEKMYHGFLSPRQLA